MIAGTAAMWVEVFAAGRLLDRDLDAPRIRQAFRTLAATRDTWPAPRNFVEAFNATTRQQAALTKQHVPARPETVAAAVAEVEAVFRVDGKTLAAGGD